MFKQCALVAALAALFSSCSPLRSSPNDEKHQLELTLHEVQTNIDDVRHDINCFQTELQILDGRIKYYENTLAHLKQHDLERHQAKLDQLGQQIQALEKKWASFETTQASDTSHLRELTSHANETTASLTQFKERIDELEKEILSQNRRFDELARLKGRIENLAKDTYKIYTVRSGDTLEKIARAHKTSVEQIKKLNSLDQDLIVVGQELKLPSD
jgi:chromosome segregation ATPase